VELFENLEKLRSSKQIQNNFSLSKDMLYEQQDIHDFKQLMADIGVNHLNITENLIGLL